MLLTIAMMSWFRSWCEMRWSFWSLTGHRVSYWQPLNWRFALLGADECPELLTDLQFYKQKLTLIGVREYF